VIWSQNHSDGFHRFGFKITRTVFTGLASKPVAMVCEWFGLKTTRTVFTGLASKPVATVCEWFGLKTTRTVFTGLASKPVSTVSSGLASKPLATVFSGLVSEPVTTVFAGLISNPVATVYGGLVSKPTATVFSSSFSKLVVAVSPGLASKPAVGFLVEPQKQGGGGFSDLGIKTGSFNLVIWVSKSPRRFLSLGLKTMWGFGLSVAPQNRRREDGADTHRDLAACFVWKQVWLGVPSLA
jgi:hypothetical protein